MGVSWQQTTDRDTTALDSIQNVVLLFSNPTWVGATKVPSTIIRNITAISANIAYSQQITDNITTLTSKYAETTNGLIQGLLYVPDLDYDDPCQLLLKDFIPPTATRQTNLPPTNYNLIALAPWITTGCTESFLESARLDPLRAMIVYRPGSGDEKPPAATSDHWSLNDEGLWKANSHFPIYAVPGNVGERMMDALGSYSGSLDEIPFAQNISDLYHPNPGDYVRIWTELTVSNHSTLPNLWVFLLAVLGVLLVVIIGISVLMHLVWRRRRTSLRNRVISGEVNLEALGIKRLTVPTSYIQTFPLFTYHYEGGQQGQPQPPQSPTTTTTNASSVGQARALSRSEKMAAAAAPASNYQPACIICLEEFENLRTIIRELPCGHIFHPECIDEFLSQISSLCPLCKSSMSPPGSCPRITNGMVRREKAIRQLRQRIVVEEDDDEGGETEADGADTDVEGGARAGRRRQRKRVQSWGSSVKRRFNISASSEKSGSNRNSGKSTTTTTTSTSGRSVVANNNAANNVPAQPAAAPAPESTAFITIGNGQSAVRIQEGPVLGLQLAEEPEEEEEVVPGGSGGDDGGDREPTSNELRARMRQLAGPSPEPQEVLEEQGPVKHAWKRAFRKVFPGFA